jgi:hypothetical protein
MLRFRAEVNDDQVAKAFPGFSSTPVTGIRWRSTQHRSIGSDISPRRGKTMSLGKVVSAAAGGVVGGAAGGVAGVGLGAISGAVATVDLRSSTTSKQRVIVGGIEVGQVAVVQSKVPGLLKTVFWGGVVAGAAALLALNPETWPIVGYIAAKAGLAGPAAGFVTGCTAKALFNVVGHGLVNGVQGVGIGGLGGAVLGANLAD